MLAPISMWEGGACILTCHVVRKTLSLSGGGTKVGHMLCLESEHRRRVVEQLR